MKKNILIVIALLLISIESNAQEINDSIKTSIIRTQANLISGNTRDVLTNFFQIALNDLIGDDKRFRFSSNLFAMRLKASPELNIDTNYVKNTFWRNSNIDIDVRINDDFKFNGAAMGYRVAIINKRDYTVAKNLGFIYRAKTNKLSDMNDSISAYIDDAFNRGAINKEKRNLLNKELSVFLQDSTSHISQFSDEFKSILKRAIPITLDDDFNYYVQKKSIYDKLIQSYKKKLLWTIGFDASTLTSGIFHDGNITSRATAGLLSQGKYSNIEFDLKGNLNIGKNHLSASKNALNQLLTFEGGLNYVIRTFEQKPVLELKAGSTYQKVISGSYVNIDKELFTLDGGIRIRITNAIWIPITFKYNPNDANLFGFLSVKSNFDWMKF
jgi:hypothetical protein